MKKQILLSAGVVFSTMMFAQQYKLVKMPSAVANISVVKNKNISDPSTPGTAAATAATHVKISPKKVNSFSETVLGTTYYDLQSNSSVGDRIWVNSDNTIAAVWTMDANSGTSANGYPLRGTGYAYFNGTTWSSAPTGRIETQRTGWPNVVNTASGKEIIVAHNTTVNNLQITRRNTKGTGTWAESTTAVPSPTTSGAWWPRMTGTGGDTLYLIAVTQQTAATPAGAPYQGLNGAVVFSRSKDAGVTWDITGVVPAGLTTANYTGFGGDAYAIACKGSTVAIVAGSEGRDVTMSKSTDAGATWTSTRIRRFPITNWDPSTQTSDVDGDNVADTIATNDGTYSVVLDNTGKAHVFFGQTRLLQTAAQANGAYSYFPATDGLFAWKESDGADAGGVLIAGVLDLNNDGTINLPTPANSGDLPFGTFGNSMTSFPSAAVDAAGTIYLSYASVVEDLPSLTDPTKLVRHTYLMKSTDNGATWSNPCDILAHDPNNPQEGVYGSMAKRVDNNIHIVYQRDYTPGYGVPSASGTANPDADNVDQSNDIVYFKVSKTDVGNCANVDVGVQEVNNSVNTVINYPNPAANSTTIDVNLKENAKMDVVIMNNMGQAVYSTHVDGNAGSNKIDVNLSNLSSGIYFYQVKVDNSKAVTRKMIIQK